MRGVMKIGIEAGKGLVPFGSMIDGEMVASKMGEMANYGFERFRNRDEERLMRETQEVLTPLFLEGVGKVAIDKTLVLLLDTYEVTGAFLDEWVRFSLLRGFANVAGGTFWGVGSIGFGLHCRAKSDRCECLGGVGGFCGTIAVGAV